MANGLITFQGRFIFLITLFSSGFFAMDVVDAGISPATNSPGLTESQGPSKMSLGGESYPAQPWLEGVGKKLSCTRKYPYPKLMMEIEDIPSIADGKLRYDIYNETREQEGINGLTPSKMFLGRLNSANTHLAK
jgi:hypothetical protein